MEVCQFDSGVRQVLNAGGIPLKACPLCLSTFEQSVRFCPYHGIHLVSCPSLDLRAGELFEGFTLLEKLSEDGLGSVYLARKSEKTYWLRIFSPSFVSNPKFISRIQGAMESSKLYKLPACCVEISGETSGSICYCASIWHGGRSLASYISDHGSYDVPRACEWIRLLAQSVLEMHESGVIHGAITPWNVYLGEDHRLYFYDARLWNILWDEDFIDRREDNPKLFERIVHQISPEIAEGSQAKTCSDIYSLGVIAYEILLGHGVLDGKDVLETLHKHINEEIPEIYEFSSDISVTDDFQDILTGAVTRSLKGRFQTAKAFLFALNYIHVPNSEDVHSLPAWVLDDTLSPERTVSENKDDCNTLVGENLYGAKTVEFAAHTGKTVEIEEKRLRDAIVDCASEENLEEKKHNLLETTSHETEEKPINSEENSLQLKPLDVSFGLEDSKEWVESSSSLGPVLNDADIDALISSSTMASLGRATEQGLRRALLPNGSVDESEDWEELITSRRENLLEDLTSGSAFKLSDSLVDMLAAEAETDSSSEVLLSDEHPKSDADDGKADGLEEVSKESSEFSDSSSDSSSENQVFVKDFSRIDSGSEFCAVSQESPESSSLHVEEGLEGLRSSVEVPEAEEPAPQSSESTSDSVLGQLILETKQESAKTGKKRKKGKKGKGSKNKTSEVLISDELSSNSEDISEAKESSVSERSQAVSSTEALESESRSSSALEESKASSEEEVVAVADGLPLSEKRRDVSPQNTVETSEMEIHPCHKRSSLPSFDGEPEISSTHDYVPSGEDVELEDEPRNGENSEEGDEEDAANSWFLDDAESLKRMQKLAQRKRAKYSSQTSHRKRVVILVVLLVILAVLLIFAISLIQKRADKEEALKAQLAQEAALLQEFDVYSAAFDKIFAQNATTFNSSIREESFDLLTKMGNLGIEQARYQKHLQTYRNRAIAYLDDLEVEYIPWQAYRSISGLQTASEAAMKVAQNCESMPTYQFDPNRVAPCRVLDASMQGLMHGLVSGVRFVSFERTRDLTGIAYEMAFTLESLGKLDNETQRSLLEKAKLYRSEGEAYEKVSSDSVSLPDWHQAIRERQASIAQRLSGGVILPVPVAPAPTAGAGSIEPSPADVPDLAAAAPQAPEAQKAPVVLKKPEQPTTKPATHPTPVPKLQPSSESNKPSLPEPKVSPQPTAPSTPPSGNVDSLSGASLASLQAQAFQAIGQKDYAKAEKILSVALSQAPSNAKLWQTKVTLEERRGRYSDAAAANKRLCSIESTSSCFVKLGDLYSKNGQYIEAKATYEKALTMSGAKVDQIQKKLELVESKL